MHITRATSATERKRLRESRQVVVGAICWFAAIVVGFGIFLGHDSQATTETAVGVRTLDGQDHKLQEVRIFVTLHPKCPCTSTTLRELELRLDDATIPFRCTFYVYRPANEPATWSRTNTASFAALLPNAELVDDVDGKFANALGMTTSGAVKVQFSRSSDGLVFGTNAAGPVDLFVGGITSARSCSVQNPGSEALRSILNGDLPEVTVTPVFGCSIVP